MKYKDLLTIILSSSVISTCITVLLSPVIELIKNKYEQNKINSERKYHEEKENKQKLAEIYVNAISIVRTINEGFNNTICQKITKSTVVFSSQKEKIEELNKKIERINNLIYINAPLMRLYATNEIFELFSNLIKYGKFSYSENIISNFLLYSFNRKFSYMCKAMQKDLGLRIGDFNLLKIYTCPSCGKEHNPEESCPHCGISWIKAIDIEEKFNEDCIEDENLQKLINTYAGKGKNPSKLIIYPVNKNGWKKNLKKSLNEIKNIY